MALGSNDFETRAQRMTRAQAETADIDVGLRKYMLRVFNYMASGVAFTGIVSLVIASDQSLMAAIVNGPLITRGTASPTLTSSQYKGSGPCRGSERI